MGRLNTVRIAIHLKNTATRQSAMLLLAVLLCAFAMPASAAKLYKWVDEDGNIRYSDRLPPQQTSKEHQQLNSQGMVLNTTDAARPPEEVAAEAEAKRKLEAEQAEAARIKAVQEQEDLVLTMTFASEAEIELARDNRIEVIDSVARLIEANIESTQKKLDRIKKNAARDYTSEGEEIPGGVAQKIEHFERKIESRNSQLQAKAGEKDKINAKYGADLERFRLLKSASNQTQALN
jgi:hypothetical protein